MGTIAAYQLFLGQLDAAEAAAEGAGHTDIIVQIVQLRILIQEQIQDMEGDE